MTMATTRNRVPRNTALDVNRSIQQSIEHSIRYHQKHKNQIRGGCRNWTRNGISSAQSKRTPPLSVSSD